MKTAIFLRDLRDGATAGISEGFTLVTKSEILRKELTSEIEFAQLQAGYIVPNFLVLYNELRLNPDYKIVISKRLLREYSRKPKRNEIN